MSQVSDEIKARQNDDGKENENEIPGSPPLNGDAQGANYHPQPLVDGRNLLPLTEIVSNINNPMVSPPMPPPILDRREAINEVREAINEESLFSPSSDSDEYHTADEGSSSDSGYISANDSDGLPEDADGQELLGEGDGSVGLPVFIPQAL